MTSIVLGPQAFFSRRAGAYALGFGSHRSGAAEGYGMMG